MIVTELEVKEVLTKLRNRKSLGNDFVNELYNYKDKHLLTQIVKLMQKIISNNVILES